MIPQIIAVILIILNLMCNAYLHGKPKTGEYNIFPAIISALLWTTLLYLGGFFNE